MTSLLNSDKKPWERLPGESYEQMLDRLAGMATHVSFTDEENEQIRSELHPSDMTEFCQEQRRILGETKIEFRTLHIIGYDPV